MFRLLWIVLLSAALGCAVLAQDERSTVFASHQLDAIEKFEDNPQVVRQMVHSLVLQVTGQPTLATFS